MQWVKKGQTFKIIHTGDLHLCSPMLNMGDKSESRKRGIEGGLLGMIGGGMSGRGLEKKVDGKQGDRRNREWLYSEEQRNVGCCCCC